MPAFSYTDPNSLLDRPKGERFLAESMGEPMAVASPAAHVSPGDTDSMRLCLALQQEELGQIQQPDFATAETDGMDDETRATLELAWRLEQEERARLQEQTAAAERLANEPEDTDSLALAIRLQQEDDEQALRNVIGVLPPDEGSEPGSPSQYTYEQLMRLGETIGEVSKGAAAEDIAALRTMSYDEASADSTVILGEQVWRASRAGHAPAAPSERAPPGRARPVPRPTLAPVGCHAVPDRPCSSVGALARSARSAAWNTRVTTRCVCSDVATRSTPNASTSGWPSTKRARCARSRSASLLSACAHRVRRLSRRRREKRSATHRRSLALLGPRRPPATSVLFRLFGRAQRRSRLWHKASSLHGVTRSSLAVFTVLAELIRAQYAALSGSDLRCETPDA